MSNGVVSIRLRSEKERQILAEAAAKAGLPLGPWVRAACLLCAGEAGRILPAEAQVHRKALIAFLEAVAGDP